MVFICDILTELKVWVMQIDNCCVAVHLLVNIRYENGHEKRYKKHRVVLKLKNSTCIPYVECS